MRLYLIRHAHAESIGTGFIRDDSERPLNARGREVAQEVATKLKELEVRFDRMVTSPLMRAVQTAEITAAITRYSGTIESCPFLARTGQWSEQMDGLLQGWFTPPSGRAPASIALVGHNPDLGDLMRAFLDLPQDAFTFPPGAVCRLDVSFPSVVRGEFCWWLDPGDLQVHDKL